MMRHVRSWCPIVLAVSVALMGLGCPVLLPEVPELIGLQEAEALDALAAVGLSADVQRRHDDVAPAGAVVDQDPPAGEQVERGSTVAVVVSRGPATVPDVVNNWLEDAEAAILAADLIVGTITEVTSPSPAGLVLSSTPVAGTLIAVDSAVNLTVSLGPDPMAGLINVPQFPAPAQIIVDDVPRSMNADLSTGAWHWFKFDGVADQKYYVHVTGNAPVNAMVFIGRDVEGTTQQVADMLWTTDATIWEFEHLFDWLQNCYECWTYPWCADCDENDKVLMAKSEKAILLPNFVAPKTATYYVVVQAARVLNCWPNCTDNDYLNAAYFDVRTFSAQVTTSTSYEQANAIQALSPYDPVEDEVLEAPFYRGVVKVNKHDWLSFDAEADSNYMIEFMLTDLSFDYGVKATLYSPLGDVVAVCEAEAPGHPECDWCGPTALYTPHAGTYYILVQVGDGPRGSGHYNQGEFSDQDLEFAQFPYIIRVLEDDHGNHPMLATAIDTPDLNEVTEARGYLTRQDEDWFSFIPAPFSVYRIETAGQLHLDLLAGGFVFENFDGRNDMTILVNDTRSASTVVPFGVQTAEARRQFDPFWLQQGKYALNVIGNDHVYPAYANVGDAEEILVPGSGAGVLWPEDMDMFVFDLAHNYYHRAISVGAFGMMLGYVDDEAAGLEELKALALNDAPVAPDAVNAGLERITLFLNPFTAGVEEDVTGIAVAAGIFNLADAEIEDLEVDYTVALAAGQYPVFTGVADPAAPAIDLGSTLSATLWPGEDHLMSFTAENAFFWYQIVVTGDDVLFEGAFVADDDGDLAPVAVVAGADGNFYIELDEVDEGGTVIYLNVLNDGNSDVAYTVTVNEDDHVNAFGDAEDATTLTTAGVAGVAWPGDTDLFTFETEAGFEYLITAVADSDALAGSALAGAVVTEVNGTWEYQVALVGDGDPWVAFVGNATDEDIAYTITLVEDDHGSTEATATVLVIDAAATAGVVWESNVDVFRFVPVAGQDYEVRVISQAGLDAELTAVISTGTADSNPDPDRFTFEFTAANTDPIFITVTGVAEATEAYSVRVQDVTP